MLNINSNASSLNAQRQLSISQNTLMTSMERLSSGLRLNSAKDDAAGFSISDRMTSQINGMNVAARNANDGISLAQTAEGGLNEISNNLQRLRELAVQSANATNTASDRAALDNEAKQLVAEIDRVSTATQFNGLSLLDGSFTAQSFQVGANAGQVIQITSIDSARTSALGGVGASYAATLNGTATTGALSAGDLTLNGFQVGASQLGALPGQSTASAYSIAQAINAISSDSNVTATANATTIAGGAASAFTAIAANTFSLNGINVGAVAAGSTAAGQGANLAAAINQVSTQTGVSASANVTTGALTLTAADGRDIDIAFNPTAGSSTSASDQLTSFTNRTGFASSNIAIAGTTTVQSGAVTAGTVAGTTTTDAVYTFAIDGNTLFTKTITAGNTGDLVTAADLDSAWSTFAASNSGYTLSGSFATDDAQITKADGTAVVLTSTATGGAGGTVTNASFAGSGFIGTAAAGSFAGTAGVASISNHGTISLSSTSASGIVYGGADATKAGFSASGTVSATTTSQVSSIASMNLLTVDSATSALSAIDGALNTVNTTRAELGAYQNRFSSAISNLQTSAENLGAARGRIEDADFAAETAALTRGQVLQQAGVAMLAQANQMPQTVLSLLR